MSLLLDALKKAAEDKEKSETDAGAPSSESAEELAPEVNEDFMVEDVVDSSPELLYEENFDLELTQDLDEIELKVDEDLIAKELKQEIAEEVTREDIPEKPAEKVVSEPVEESVQNNEKPVEVAPIELTLDNLQSEKDADLSDYNHNDARKILELSQKRYRSSQRMAYYGLYIFAALLFFAGSYLYYTAEILDNSDKPIFKNNKAYIAALTEKEIKIEQQVSIAKSKLSEMDRIENKNTATTTKPVRPAPVAKIKPKKITITKKKKLDPLSVLVQKAYMHYQAGEYQLADSLYQKILVRDKRLHDALLGRAAIAVVRNELNLARNIYQQLLRYYPRDSIATSALVDLTHQELTIANESQLKVLLRNNPGAAHVHFSLGLLYAKQERIKESQQAFFDAFALKKKADYAYNLAVMLDKLGQSKAALNYYKKASNLSDNSVSNFNEKLALERITQLESENE